MAKLKPLILFLIFLGAITHSVAQSIEWSNQQKVKSKTYYAQVLGQNAAGIFLLRSKTNDFAKELTLERYKPNLSLELSKELPINSGAYLEKMILLESGMLVFSSKKNSETDMIDLFYQKTDDNLNAAGTPVVVLSVFSSLFKDNSNFYIRTSANKKFFSVVYLTRNATDKNTSTFHIITLNDQMAVVYKKEFALKYETEDVYITSIEADNNGNVFTLIDFPKSLEKRGKNKGVRSFFLYGYLQKDEKMATFDLGKDSLFIADLGMSINNYNNSVAIGGYYSKENDDNKAAGHFYYLIDLEMVVVKTKVFEDFDKNFIAKVAGSMQNENTTNLTDLAIRRIIPRSDGGCMIVGEKYYESRQMYTYYVNGFPQTSSRTVYNFDEIVVISKNADGTTQFRDFIKKKQSSVADAGYYSSFVLLNTNERLSFIYNSDTGDDGDVMISTLNPKGETDTRILIKALSYYVSIMPPESRQVSGNVAIISTLKDKRFSLLRITY